MWIDRWIEWSGYVYIYIYIRDDGFSLFETGLACSRADPLERKTHGTETVTE